MLGPRLRRWGSARASTTVWGGCIHGSRTAEEKGGEGEGEEALRVCEAAVERAHAASRPQPSSAASRSARQHSAGTATRQMVKPAAVASAVTASA